MTDNSTANRIGLATGEPFPATRSPDPIPANEDTLHQELAAVADRHNSDLAHAQIVRALFDFADTYAEVYDVARHVEHRDPPPSADRDEEVGMVVVPDAAEHLAPIGFDAGSGGWLRGE